MEIRTIRAGSYNLNANVGKTGFEVIVPALGVEINLESNYGDDKNECSLRFMTDKPDLVLAKIETETRRNKNGYTEKKEVRECTIRPLEDKDDNVVRYLVLNGNEEITSVLDELGRLLVSRREDRYNTNVYRYKENGLIEYTKILLNQKDPKINKGIILSKENDKVKYLRTIFEYLEQSRFIMGINMDLSYFDSWKYYEEEDAYVFKAGSSGMNFYVFNKTKPTIEPENYMYVYKDEHGVYHVELQSNIQNILACSDYVTNQRWHFTFEDEDSFTLEVFEKNDIVEIREIKKNKEVMRYIMEGDIKKQAGYNVNGSYVIIDNNGDYCIKSNRADVKDSARTNYNTNDVCPSALKLAMLTYNEITSADTIESIIKDALDTEIYSKNGKEYHNSLNDTMYLMTNLTRGLKRIADIKTEWDYDAIYSEVAERAHVMIKNKLSKEHVFGIKSDIKSNLNITAFPIYNRIDENCKLYYSIDNIGLLHGKFSDLGTWEEYGSKHRTSGCEFRFDLVCENMDASMIVVCRYVLPIFISSKEVYDEYINGNILSHGVDVKRDLYDSKLIGESKDGKWYLHMLSDLTLNNIELFSVESEQLGDTYNQPELGLGGVYFSLKNIHSPIGKMKMIYDILAEVRR